jgi:hypothetical protein
MDENIFREYDIRGIVGKQLTDQAVATIAHAIGSFFARNGAKRIALGYDARESSPRFCDLLTAGLNQTGCDAVLIGQVPTPVLYHSVFTKSVDGGVMITGSHNPADHNGFKICLGTQTLFGSQIQEIKQIALSGNFASGAGSVESLDVLEDYIADIVSRINVGTRTIKAVVDAGNGMGGVTGVPVFEKLGVELIKLYVEPDSTFPNHHPDPTVTENLADTVEALAPAVRPGGHVVVGEPFWRRLPLPDDYEDPYRREPWTTLEGTVTVFETSGLPVVAVIASSQDDWDRYETLHWQSIEGWLAENPDDPDAAEIRSRRDHHKRIYLRHGRDVLGWAIFVGWKGP